MFTSVSLGDRLPFVIMALCAVLACVFPRGMSVVAVGWSVFATGGLIISIWKSRKREGMKYRFSATQALTLWSAFNSVSFIVLFIAWRYWPP